ncbi:hypothetical protein D3C80_1704950 [compost metagenome]
MNYQTYIRFVDTHSECIGSNDYPELVANPCILFPEPVGRRNTCMIKIGFNTIDPQKLSNFLRFATVANVNNAASRYFSQNFKQFFMFIFAISYHIRKVTTFKTFLKNIAVFKKQFFLNILFYL